MKKLSYQYRKSHCGDKTVVRSFYPHNGISYTGKMTSLYWVSPLHVVSNVSRLILNKQSPVLADGLDAIVIIGSVMSTYAIKFFEQTNVESLHSIFHLTFR